MQRTARTIIASAAIAGFGLAGTPGPATAAAAPPSCGNPAPVTAHDGSSAWISLGATCQDADLDHLTFEIVTPPEHGDLSEADDYGNVEYTPDAGYLGEDSFQFRANDGDEVSTTLTVAITVEPNRPPECEDMGRLEVEPGVPNPVWVYCWDPETFDELTYTVVDQPQHGTAGDPETWGHFTYTPDPGYHGPDSFTFTAGDGLDESAVTTVHLTVLRPNTPPSCAPSVTLRVAPGGSLPLDPSIACSDPEGDDLSPSLVTGPEHGSFSFPGGVLTYTPDAGYSGPDRIEYRVVDPRGARSNVGVLRIVVGDPPRQVTTLPDTRAPGASFVPMPGQSLKDVRRKGLKLLVLSNEAAQVTMRLSVSKKAARRLGLARDPLARVAIGSGDRRVRAGATHVSVSLDAKARKAFRRTGRVKLLVSTLMTDAAGNSTAVAKPLTLRRR